MEKKKRRKTVLLYTKGAKTVATEVVFANCVTWPSTLVAAVARKALRLRPGAVMISGKSCLALVSHK